MSEKEKELIELISNSENPLTMHILKGNIYRRDT